MLVYYKNQLLYELKTVKIWIVSLAFFITAFLVSYYSNRLDFQFGKTFTLIHLLYGLFAFMTFLFSSILFSGVFAREIENESLRFITPYITRFKIYFAKLLTMITIFLVILSVSLGITFVVASVRTFPIFDTIVFLLFLVYIQSMILIISLVSPNDRLASIIGLLFSLISPILFILSTVFDNPILNAINWLLPFRYLGLENRFEALFLVFQIILLIFLGNKMFERKEI